MLTSLPTQAGLRLASQNSTSLVARSFTTAISTCRVTSQAVLQSPSSPTSPPRHATMTRLTSNSLLQSTSRQPPTRHASTAANAVAGNPEATSQTSPALDWNAFFRLRTTRRYYSLSSSIAGLVASTAGTFHFLTAYPDQSDYVVKLIPMDPIISTGIAMTAAMLTGWLLGPIFGNGIWRLLYRKRLPEFTLKERAFFERIKKHRVNPAGASTNNPVPDFYGEKIGSVQGYRRWLKDQRAFNRKRGGNFASV